MGSHEHFLSSADESMWCKRSAHLQVSATDAWKSVSSLWPPKLYHQTSFSFKTVSLLTMSTDIG